MRILMLAHRIPYPPHTGDKVRAFHIARYLAQRHELTLAFLVDDPVDRDGVEVLRKQVGRIEWADLWKPWGMINGLVGLASKTPLTLRYFASRKLRNRLAYCLAEDGYDLIYVSSSSMAQYVEHGTTAPVVMDFVDVDSDKWIQYAQKTRPPLAWVYRAEGRLLRDYEAAVARMAGLCLLSTVKEEALLTSFAPWARTAVIPNGVDLTYFALNGHAASEPVVVFTGAMDYLPNIDAVQFFCTQILPKIQKDVSGARFFIVGLNPAPSVVRLGKLTGVVVTGAVPDVRPFYAQASVCVAPLRIARGVQNKVLQAMAMGLPVVATRQACEGIEAQPEQDLLVEDDPAAFAARIIELLKKPETRSALGRRARAFVEAHHSWDASLSRLDGLLHSVAASATSASFAGTA
jgi:sugar transferase (PEP-CTERM/EpsH1 system associated)